MTTHEERQVAFDTARRTLGDVQMNPSSSEADHSHARDAVNRAGAALRGTPHTLLRVAGTAGYVP